MSRYILRFKGESARPPATDVERIRALHELQVLDDSSPRMLLVEAPDAKLKSLAAALPDWIVTPEQTIQLPDLSKKVRRRRKGAL